MQVNPAHGKIKDRCTGAATLSCVALLLTLTSLASLYAVDVSMLNLRVDANTQSKLRIEQAATTALDDAISRIQSNISIWSNQEFDQQDKWSKYQVNSEQQNIQLASHAISAFTLRSQAFAVHDSAAALQQQDVIGFPLLAKIPDAPLMVNGEVKGSQHVSIVANPNGAGNNLPISVWSAQPIADTESLPTTCLIYEFRNGLCAQQGLSRAGFKSADIVDSSDTFPVDLLSYLTPLQPSKWMELRDEASLILANCDNLNSQSKGFIWIQNDCTLPLGLQLGSAENPVLLVIQQGRMIMPSLTTVTGLLVLMKPKDAMRQPEIELLAHSAINGAVISTADLLFSRGTLQIIFAVEVLENLQQSPNLWKLARVPGSWRDF